MAIVLSRSEVLSLADTMGTLLGAVVEAQAQSARTTIDFISEVGFAEKLDEDAKETLRTIQFRYQKLDENQVSKSFAVEIPLLAMVDIPIVSVKQATFDFSYEVTSATASGGASSEPSRLGSIRKVAVIKGRVARSPADQHERANLQISVQIEKAALPIGLERVLDILEVASREEKEPEVE